MIIITINIKYNTQNNYNFLNNYGFYYQEYFSEIFKKIIGVSPIKYKKLFYNHNSLNQKDYETILNFLIKIKEIIKVKEDYLKNRKPKNNLTKFSSILKK